MIVEVPSVPAKMSETSPQDDVTKAPSSSLEDKPKYEAEDEFVCPELTDSFLSTFLVTLNDLTQQLLELQ